MSRCFVPLLLAALAASAASQTSCVATGARSDCGYVGVDADNCKAKGCCWVPATGSNDQDTPWCFYPNGAVPTPAPGAVPYTPAEGKQLIKYFLQNTNYQDSGATIAAPSTSHPDYFYHWVRDAAISMNVVLKLDNGTSPIPAATVDATMANYVKWVANVHTQADPNGIDVRGEPKFYTNGRVYDKPWGRPQNDGPGLRARALVNYAHRVLDGKSPGGQAYVEQSLYHPGDHTLPIANDLKYVEQQWKADSFDLWEEINGQHFFTKMAQRKSLLAGAGLARRLNDTSTAEGWESTAREIEGAIDAHWNADLGVVMETLPPHGGTQKYHELDCAIVLGALEGDNGDGFYGPTSERVTATAAALQQSLVGVYGVNAADDARGLPGFLIGRYPNDTYDGYATGQIGDPWFLCTQAYGELYYHHADEALRQHALHVRTGGRQGRVRATALSAPFLAHGSALLAAAAAEGAEGAEVRGDALLQLAQEFMQTGDDYLTRTRYHAVGNQLHLSEQINHDTGFEQGAPDLTWSYGTVLSALNVRGRVFSALQAARSS